MFFTVKQIAGEEERDFVLRCKERSSEEEANRSLGGTYGMPKPT
jgi:hypothetical protein